MALEPAAIRHELQRDLAGVGAGATGTGDASVEVDNARDAYAAALATMCDAAGKRAKIGRELSRTKERAWIWRKWLRYHHWGRHMHPLLRRRWSGDE